MLVGGFWGGWGWGLGFVVVRKGEEWVDGGFTLGLAIVVLRGREEDVGAEGGGGREMERREVDGMREARQRKHSPVP